jgi:ferredoxin
MSTQVDPNLMNELKQFGLKDANKCFHCGNCTAICPLSTPENPFPRKLIKYAQMGLKDRIKKSPEPWLCYFCGDCSTKCPRGADPGETMMVMRRYLTSLYDWTGFARKFYTSELFEIVAVSIVALAVGLAFWLFHGPVVLDRVALNTFAPNPIIEIGDLIMAAVLTTFLLSNVFRCYLFVMGEQMKVIPLRHYILEAKELILHMLTQKSFNKCTEKMPWIIHLLIMTGYSSVFLLVVVFIRWFQRDEEIYSFFHPIRLVGYYATFAILYGTTYAMIGRLKKSRPAYKNSHGTDWMFLILLQLTTLTGIFIHFTRLLEWPMPTYVIYVVHMMVAVPMLVLEVPFAKWAHLAYRPVVLYLVKVQERYAKETGDRSRLSL